MINLTPSLANRIMDMTKTILKVSSRCDFKGGINLSEFQIINGSMILRQPLIYVF